VQQIVGPKPDDPTGAIHFAADEAFGCAEYGALRGWVAPQTAVAHELNTITRLESIELH
jgi:hypothetical protein